MIACGLRMESIIRTISAVILLALLAGCETAQPAFGECDEGVSDLARMSDVAPPTC